ncbi:MAG TPA: phosphatidylglycerol lysyltransferase domain-containing protein [Anaerolineales bacterium]|nr:phosphatidylglycerol lysyltransferase domain-containing protein [Anaerolineales bacterium]
MLKSRPNFETLGVQLVALMTALMGIVNVLSAVTPSVISRLRLLEKYSPLEVSRGGHLTSALAGFALLVLSVSLWRRKRLGWLLTLGILVISIVAHLLKGLDYEEAILAAMLAGILIIQRSHFHARSDEPSIKQGLQLVAASLGFTLAYGVLGFYLLDRHYSVNFGFWAAVRQTVVMFTEFYNPGLQPITGFGRYFAASIYFVGAATMGYALLILLRPVLARQHATQEERAHAWEVVRQYGHTPLARYALLDDKLFFFSAGGSVISYVVENRVALVLGDPIGPVEDVASAISAFKAFCALNDWLPAFYQTLPDYLEVYRKAKFEALPLGQEAILDLKKFTLEGGENKNIRNAHSKMVRNGYKSEVIEPPFSQRMLRELNAISDDWLSSRGVSEMRFSLGWFDEAYLNTCSILLIRDREGFIDAFANIVTEFQSNEVTIDMMRHRHYSEKGIMDFLFVSLFQWAKEKGYERFNLGLSAFSGIGAGESDRVIERGLSYIYQNVNRFYNFKGLHAFKEKFHPDWSLRYLIYPNAAALPEVSVSLLRANLGGRLFSLFSKN